MSAHTSQSLRGAKLRVTVEREVDHRDAGELEITRDAEIDALRGEVRRLRMLLALERAWPEELTVPTLVVPVVNRVAR